MAWDWIEFDGIAGESIDDKSKPDGDTFVFVAREDTASAAPTREEIDDYVVEELPDYFPSDEIDHYTAELLPEDRDSDYDGSLNFSEIEWTF